MNETTYEDLISNAYKDGKREGYAEGYAEGYLRGCETKSSNVKWKGEHKKDNDKNRKSIVSKE